MTDPRWDKIGALVEKMQAAAPEERALLLEEHCDDPAVREEVAELLSIHEEASGFFDSVADGVAARALNELQKAEKRCKAGSDPLGLEGKQLAQYAVEEHLGGGGMGIVYKARDTRLGRPVALKFLSPHLAANEEAELRFVREAQAASTLDHPHIATIYEIGTIEEESPQGRRRFIAMAYYDGVPLKQKIEQGPLSVEAALDFATQIAKGLRCAHEASIVHRDIKPANVIVTEDGVVKLVDFGLAKAAAASGLTDPGRRLGTAAYMSPEQAHGKNVDHRTDLWALGVVLYEMLTSQRPFHRGHDTATLYAILHEEPKPVRQTREEIPVTLAQIVKRLLAKDPEKRYPTAGALLRDLRAVRRGKAPAWSDIDLTDTNAPDRSIAVLPFETLGTKEPTAFTKGIHGDVLTRLSNVADLKVISRTSVRQYQNTEKTILKIGRELSTSWVLEGEVQEAADQIQVNVRLINARADRQVWSKDYRRKLTAENLFQIQDEITKEIVRSLEAKLTPEEEQRVSRRPTENLDAYRLYAQGRRSLDQRTEDGIRRALDCFQHAIRQDFNYALAWAGLTDALSLFQFYGFTPPNDTPNPMKAARRAVELNPNLGETRAALGILHSIRHEGPAALRELKQAVELTPSYAEAHIWLGWLQLCLGHPTKALASAEQAVELNPLAPAVRVYLAEIYLANGNEKYALREAQRAREIQPEYGLTHFVEGLVLYHQERLVAATSSWQQALSLVKPYGAPTHAEIQAALAVAHAVSGDKTRAYELNEKIDEADHPFSVGLVYAALCNEEKAFEAFEREEHWGSFSVDHFRYFFPNVLGPLRQDPRYEELLRSVNQSWGLDPERPARRTPTAGD